MIRAAHATRTVRGIVLGSLGLTLLLAAPAWADDFRVENAIFLDNEKQPRIESTTIFAAGLVYDYLKSPAEVTVFDPSRGRFVLLDLSRRVRTEVDLLKIHRLCEQIQTWAAKQSDPLLNFLAHPRFDEQAPEGTGRLALSSPLVSYELTTAAMPTPAISTAYRQFSDAYSELNALLNPGSRPPFARLVLNDVLDRRQQFPQEVKLTLQVGSGFSAKRTVIRSQHRLATTLVEADRDRVAQTGQYLTIFSPVAFEEYQKKVAE